jgi:GWxTD domain-containing protein
MTPLTLSRPAATALVAGLLVLVAGCGASRSPEGAPAPGTDQTLTEIFNLPAVYNRMGRLASGPPVAFVGNLVYLAGRSDSTVVNLALSLSNRALSFQREDRSFAARFRTEVTFQRSGTPAFTHSRDEVVRVSGFEETQRPDESVVTQQGFLLAPGEYTAAIVVRDLNANIFSRLERQVTVPAFGPGSTSGPVLIYQSGTRQTVAEELPVLLNPRGTVAHGAMDTLLIYVEGYRFPSRPTTVPVIVRDDQGEVVYQDSLVFQGGREVESRLVRLGQSTPPLGELTVSVTDPDGRLRETQALVSFSRGWVVTNYDNLLSLMRFFQQPSWVTRLSEATPEERGALWREFWLATDPVPETPENEALDQYFTRLAIANERFRDEGPNAWRSERGEVYITLGEPDVINTNSPTSDRRLEQWVYNEYRGVLLFEGVLGLSRMRMLPSSRGEFARMRALVMRR